MRQLVVIGIQTSLNNPHTSHTYLAVPVFIVSREHWSRNILLHHGLLFEMQISLNDLTATPSKMSSRSCKFYSDRESTIFLVQ